MKIAIMGAGGIGGCYGGLLAQAGIDVTLIARGAHLKAITERGLQLIQPDFEFTVDVAATDDPSVVELGIPLLAMGALFQFFDAGGIIAEGALRGAGDTRWPFLIHSALGWGFFVPSAYVLGIVLDGGLTGAWLAGTVYVVMLASVLVWRFRSGAWRQVEI